MNRLEKFFNTLHTAQSKVLKRYTTEELISQIKEYIDYLPYILKQVYKLLCSQASEDRKNGAKILESLMFNFKLMTNFKIEYNKGNSVYLSSTGEQFTGLNSSIQEQKRMVKKIAKLEHVEANFLSEIDFKASGGETIKKKKVEEKPVENIHDFFNAITNNLLSYEWYKRHGSFLAFTSMFTEETDGEIQIGVDSSLFSKIYEILVTDKFNDFVDDRTVAPVRDAAAHLLGCIYPLLGPNNIIEEIINFLSDDDWQVQFSGLLALNYLKAYVKDNEDVYDRVLSLMSSPDEDIKYMCADLLYYFPLRRPNEVLEKCWENIESDEVIAVSKTSTLNLLTKIYKELPGLISTPDIVKKIFPCFTSPVPEVRLSAQKMADIFSDESIDFLVSEVILIEEKEEVRDEALVYMRKKEILSKNLVTHFLNVIGGSLYEPYREEDFVSYEEHYFTKSGVMLVGRNEILKNRVLLFEYLSKNYYEEIETHGKSITDIMFRTLYKKLEILKTNFKVNDLNTIQMEVKEVDEYYKILNDMKKVPLKEFKRKIENPDINSIHPMVDTIYVDYISMIASLKLPNFSEELIIFYKKEECKVFLDFISKVIVAFHDKSLVDVYELLVKAYNAVIDGHDGFISIFTIFNDRIYNHKIFSWIKEQANRLIFFSKTIEIYSKSSKVENLQFLFDEALEKRETTILKGMVKVLDFNEQFVRRMLVNLDVPLLYAVLPEGDHSFNPLFVKTLLSKIANNQYRIEASSLFSNIIPTLNFQTNQNITEDLKILIADAKKSLDSLLDSSKIEEYKIKCPMTAKLRDYQTEGVRWLAFLNSFNLNGILADDMGLGKTLQVLTFLCSEVYQTANKVLVICPSSLTGHWKSEVEKFFPFMNPKIYKKDITDYNILIVSYECFRNDYTSFIDKEWFYVVADEGHVLRNRQTMLYTRICMLKCPRKLVVTGTPVHNSVDDLVTLFNFIMPNYLGNEKEISHLSVKMSDTEIEKAHAKLETLHKKALPFVLRRLKMDVLKDLPPKIICDINVELGPEQEALYKELSTNGKIEEKDAIQNDEISYGKINVKGAGFKRTRDLIYATSHIGHFKTSSETSCKVKALEDIISLCGGDDIRNKILIFFQYKSTMDLVIKDLTKKYKFKYSKLDGSVQSSARSKMADDFNTGTTQIMFLTTQVGGLGLNLTGADTVVLYEHDWNPFNDLQAMDRAHRIGQKRTVNVYRLIVKNTLEEKVMNLQSFKLFVANSLISQQNSEIESMNTKDLLERFQNLG